MTSVLYVDTNAEIRDLVRRTFEETGAILVHPAGSAEEALAVFSLRPIDVIVSDYHLPGIDGIGLLKTLRQAGVFTPFIFFTHDFSAPLKERACFPNVFRFNGRNGCERKEILRLLRIVYWVTGNHEAGGMPVATDESQHNKARPGGLT